VKCDTATADGFGDTITSDAVDITGATSVLCCVDLGAIAATGTATIQVTECATSGGSYTDITGATIAAAADDDNKILFLEVVNPTLQYLKIDVDRATANSAINTMFCICNVAHGVLPVVQDATVAATPTRHVG